MNIISVIIIIVVITIIIKQANQKSQKGSNNAEIKVSNYLGKSIIDEKYMLNNLVIFINNSSTEIDHVLISKKGVFVIETKGHMGHIYGSEDDFNWSQILSYGKTKNKIYNPIKQNNTHIDFLKTILKRDDIFKSIIVFPNAKLNVNTKTPTGNLSIINKAIEGSTINLSKDEINSIYNRLNKLKIENINLKEQHIANLKEKEQLINKNMCPNCKVSLIRRKGKYGIFYSCPNFPRCSHSKK